MTIQPIPCLSTELDGFELADLRMRLESLAARVVAGGEPKSGGGGGFGLIADAHGRITMQQQVKALVISAEAWQGMGGLKLTMPMPGGRDERQAKAGRLSKADVIRLLYTWLGYVDTGPSGTSARPALGSSGYVRLVSYVSALIRAANPQVGPNARFTVVAAPPYEEETDMHTSARIPALLHGSKPIIASDIERTLLRLHPGALIERNQSTRSFRLAVREPFECAIADISIAETMRAVGDLDLRNHRKPVLKAGMDMR
jgi:hypothetical protein